METTDRTATSSSDHHSHDTNELDAFVNEQQQQRHDDRYDEEKGHNENVQLQLHEEDSTLNGTSSAGGFSRKQKEWFEDVAGPDARDAMTALQLDYRFDGDTFAGTWWVHLQNLGFVHRYNGGGGSGGGGSAVGVSSSSATTTTTSASSGTTLRAYQLPTTGPWAVPQQGDDDQTYCYYDASGIYEELDSLAIPQVTSAFDSMPLSRDIAVMTAAKEEAPAAAMTEWWRSVRNELIFRRFHKEIEREYGRRVSRSSRGGRKGSDGDEDLSRHSKRPKRSISSRCVADSSGIMSAPTKRPPRTKNKVNDKNNKRNSKDQKNGGDENNINDEEVDESENIEFPTLDEYLAARQKTQSTFGLDSNQQEQLFSEWRFLLGSHCSLLLYGGGGSKRSFVNQFASEELSKDGDVITVNGFDPRATIEGILQLLIDHWFAGYDPTTTFTSSSSSLPLCYRSGSSCGTYDPSVDSSVVDRAILIARRVSRIVSQASLRPVYIVLHNIDGISLRNKTAQRALAALVDESRTILHPTRNIKSGLCAIRLVTTIDHINAPLLLWDTFTRHRFQFVWKEVPSLVLTRYVEEVACDDGTIRDLNLKSSTTRRRSSGGNSRQSSSAGLYGVEAESTEESIFGVLTSLASRHAQVLQQLAELQLKSIATLEHQDPASSELSLSSKRTKKKDREVEENKSWVPYTDLLRQCRHQFIVANDSQLRSYIGELLDHSIVEQRSSSSTRGGNRGRTNGGSAIGSSSYRIPHSIHILDMIIDFDPANDDKK